MGKNFRRITIALGCLPLAAFAAPKYSDWGPATLVGGCIVNSSVNDQGPTISRDGLSVYFSSVRPGVGGQDVWLTRRSSPDSQDWTPPVNVEAINTTFTDGIPSLSRDGHWLFLNSDRPGGLGDIDLWVSYRAHTHDDFAWEPPVNLGPGVNTSRFDAGAILFENENGPPLLFMNRATSQANQSDSDIYVARLLEDGTFGTAVLVEKLNTPQLDSRAAIRFDGLEVIFFSSRPVPPGQAQSLDLWTSTRNSLDEDWSPPVWLESVNTPFEEINPYLSHDGTALLFASNRPGCGARDVWMTTRTKLKGNAD